MNLNEFFNHLASDNSRLFKTANLISNEGDGELREVIRLTLDPFTQFYIRKIPAYTKNDSVEHSLVWALGELYKFSSRELTGNKAIDHLKYMLTCLTIDDALVLERIIKKDLKCGVSVATVNDVWMGLIKEYPVMLCSAYNQKLVDKITFPAYVQLKEDGMRFNAIVKHTEIGSSVEYRSRNGKELDLLGNLDDEFIAMSNLCDTVFDGELLVMIDGKVADRQTGNGILSKAGKGTLTVSEAALVCATVWDTLSYIYFADSHCPTPYSQRLDKLTSQVSACGSDRIMLVPSNTVDTIEEAQVIFEGYLADGKEGIILKSMNGDWGDKRSKDQIKFKGELECDLVVTGVETGTGKYQGMLGSLICASSDNLISVGVGSGFNDEQRRSLGSDMVGKVIAVKYNARIVNKQGGHSLFLPIFIEVRDDKDVADHSNDVK
jgi:hypothetical protein